MERKDRELLLALAQAMYSLLVGFPEDGMQRTTVTGNLYNKMGEYRDWLLDGDADNAEDVT